MDFFVDKHSIVRRIWSKSDTILFIFGGAAAEFALNKAVDWLYFTGKLPADPIGRLFSTVQYAREIVFSTTEKAHAAIDRITAIHGAVEKNRGAKIPDWAYRDVLFMLIHYSIASYELLERKLDAEEKEELYNVFYRMGQRMGLKDLPSNYPDWKIMHEDHLNHHLQRSRYTDDLFLQYKKHLGAFRYWILWESQKLVVPVQVRNLLSMKKRSAATPLLFIYKPSRKIGLDKLFKAILLPAKYRREIGELDRV